MAKEQNNVGMIISVALVILLGIVFVSIISSEIVNKTELVKVTETVDLSPARGVSGLVNSTYPFHLTHGCPLATPWRVDVGECELVDYGVANNSGHVLTGGGVDYTFVTNGATCTGVEDYLGDLYFSNSSDMNYTGSNTTTVTYAYCADGYVSGWGGTIANLVPGFIALALLIGAGVVIIYILKREGID